MLHTLLEEKSNYQFYTAMSLVSYNNGRLGKIYPSVQQWHESYGGNQLAFLTGSEAFSGGGISFLQL